MITSPAPPRCPQPPQASCIAQPGYATIMRNNLFDFRLDDPICTMLPVGGIAYLSTDDKLSASKIYP
jgi:hypothetical protein